MNGVTPAVIAAATSIQAIKASGTIVKVEPKEFEKILARQSGLLVVTARGGLLSTNYQYLTNYKGLAFFTKSSAALNLPGGHEVIQAEKIWIPG